MKMIDMKRLITLFAFVLCNTIAYAQAEKIRLYDGKAPGSEKWTQEE